MGELTIYPKHPHTDAYRVGGFWSPYCLVSTEKRFSDAELAAEYWQAEVNYRYMRDIGGDIAVTASHRASALLRFATLPNFDEDTK